MMSPRERLRAAFYPEPCDHVPYAPHVDGYFFSSLDHHLRNGSLNRFRTPLQSAIDRQERPVLSGPDAKWPGTLQLRT